MFGVGCLTCLMKLCWYFSSEGRQIAWLTYWFCACGGRLLLANRNELDAFFSEYKLLNWLLLCAGLD